jgi:hypothetical protein
MENNQIEPRKTLPTSSMPEMKRAERLGWIIDQLVMAAAAKGQIHTAERLQINAEDLIDIPQDALALAFDKARKELDYVLQVSQLRRLALADEAGKLDAEMRAAWDVLMKFVNKWCRWNDGYFDGENSHVFSARVETGAPELPQRITDTVRRTGGWATYLGMEPSDFPFQQKRFFEEYQAWAAVERVLPDLAKVLQLPEAQIKQLTGSKTMDNAARNSALPPNFDAPVKTPTPKSVPEPLTEFQWAERKRHAQQLARANVEKQIGHALTDEEYEELKKKAAQRVFRTAQKGPPADSDKEAIRQRTKQDAVRDILPSVQTETADDAGRETVQCSSRARATRKGAATSGHERRGGVHKAG